MFSSCDVRAAARLIVKQDGVKSSVAIPCCIRQRPASIRVILVGVLIGIHLFAPQSVPDPHPPFAPRIAPRAMCHLSASVPLSSMQPLRRASHRWVQGSPLVALLLWCSIVRSTVVRAPFVRSSALCLSVVTPCLDMRQLCAPPPWVQLAVSAPSVAWTLLSRRCVNNAFNALLL